MQFDANSPILVVFCRRPSPGVGKQRIAAELGEAKALEISNLLLAAALEDAATWRDRVVIAPASADDADWAAGLIPGADVIAQPEGSLGERIQYVDTQIRKRGGRTIIFIGSDAPALDAATLVSAVARLGHEDMVIAPAADGGVTLLGSRVAWPDLSVLPWETNQLAHALVESCEQTGHAVAQLPLSYDIDRRADLDQALRDLQTDPRPSRRNLCAWIRAIVPSEDRLSVIVPVYADIAALEKLLDRLRAMSGIDEIIVVDGEGNSACRRLCHLRDVLYMETKACRGAQLIAGAAAASGDILWFLHADSEPGLMAPQAMRRHIDSGYTGGFFTFRFVGPQRWYKSALAAAINLRTRFGTPYGDQGLFVRRVDYEAAGGFAATPLFEEVSLVKKLRKQGAFRNIGLEIGVSPRRWEQDGWLIRSLRNRLLAMGFMVGIPAEKLVRRYPAANAGK